MLELDKIYCGDNCDLLGQLPRECIDLVVTSPPYDDLRTYGGHSWDFFGVAWQLKRVLKPGGVIVWVVADAMKGRLRRVSLAVFIFSQLIYPAQAQSLKETEIAALSGDYQAQRNLAFGYASWPLEGQKKDAIKACAWYLLVLRSDSPKLNVGDVSNVLTYCDKLDPTLRLQAERIANSLHRKIGGQRM